MPILLYLSFLEAYLFHQIQQNTIYKISHYHCLPIKGISSKFSLDFLLILNKELGLFTCLMDFGLEGFWVSVARPYWVEYSWTFFNYSQGCIEFTPRNKVWFLLKFDTRQVYFQQKNTKFMWTVSNYDHFYVIAYFEI